MFDGKRKADQLLMPNGELYNPYGTYLYGRQNRLARYVVTAAITGAAIVGEVIGDAASNGGLGLSTVIEVATTAIVVPPVLSKVIRWFAND